jgi:aldose sugar dehydrogenase
VTYGRNYGMGTRIGEEGPKPGFEQPLQALGADLDRAQRHGLPDQRPLPGLEGQPVHRRAARPGAGAADAGRRTSVTGEERLLQNLGERIRDVRQGPDGWLYLLTDRPTARCCAV